MKKCKREPLSWLVSYNRFMFLFQVVDKKKKKHKSRNSTELGKFSSIKETLKNKDII